MGTSSRGSAWRKLHPRRDYAANTGLRVRITVQESTITFAEARRTVVSIEGDGSPTNEADHKDKATERTQLNLADFQLICI
jgi:hypothetical protein